MQAKRDENRVTTLLATLNTDGITPVAIKANPTTHRLEVSGETGTGVCCDAKRDENRVPVLMAVSSLDGVTPVPIQASDLFNLLITNK